MDRPRWNLKALREHVRHLAGDRRFALSVISSLDWSDRIFNYHFCLARDALRAIPVDDDPNSIANLEMLFSVSDENEGHMLSVRANVLACIYTVRNAFDYLAQLGNALLVSNPLPIEDCDLKKMHKRPPDSGFRQELDQLLASQWFQYVAAYSNTSKHCAVVQQSLHLSFADGVAGIRAEAFIHDKEYPAYMVGDLLEGILEVKNRIVTCGRTLNIQVVPSNV